MNAAQLTDAIVETVRALDEAVSAWCAGDRKAVRVAIAAAETGIAQLHRVRDQLAREAREYDQHHRPYDPRD